MKEKIKTYLPLAFFYISIVFLVLAFANSFEQTKSAIEGQIQIAQINNIHQLFTK